MAGLFLNYCILPLALLAFASAEGYARNLGECDAGLCNSGCALEHGGTAKGYCDSSSSPPSCKCYFESTKLQSPSNKKCTMGIGPCSSSCNDQCCNSKCAAKYGGAIGYCLNGGPQHWSDCLCTYPC